jgi:Cu+-exporting ATPase
MSHSDPVCGMHVDERRAAQTQLTFAGRTFYFCSQGCKEAFENDPYRYSPPLDPSKGSPAPPGAPQR